MTPTVVSNSVGDAGRRLDVEVILQGTLAEAIRADVALVKAAKADELGNLCYAGTARNFNPEMATAADVCIAEVDEVAPGGAGMTDTASLIASRVAAHLHLTTWATSASGSPPRSPTISASSPDGAADGERQARRRPRPLARNGGPRPGERGQAARHRDARRRPPLQRGVVRDDSRRSCRRRRARGVGGAMDLLIGARNVIIATTHVTRDGAPKVVPSLVVTDHATFEVDHAGLTLVEVAEHSSLTWVRSHTTASFRVRLEET